jgi:hypothetical protein
MTHHQGNRAALLALAAISLASAGACASAAVRNPRNLPGEQLAVVRKICQHNIGADPGTGLFGACVGSLSDAIIANAGRGGEAKAIGMADVPKRTPYRPYFIYTPKSMKAQERLSCAELGLDTASSGFAGCVANLDHALEVVDRPQNGDPRSFADSPFGAETW